MPEAWAQNIKPLLVAAAGLLIVIIFVVWCVAKSGKEE